MLRTILALTVAATFFASASVTQAQDKAASHDNVDKKHLAVQGYDVVSYFTTGKPVKGNEKITATHNGHTYRFASHDNHKKFEASPESYVPQYGGWCATAMVDGKKVEIDPANFKITRGKLYLFYKSFFADALPDWNKDESSNILKANAAWKKITQ